MTALRHDPAFLFYYARVLMREARARRGDEFTSFLVRGARRAVHEAVALRRTNQPAQGDLFRSHAQEAQAA